MVHQQGRSEAAAVAAGEGGAEAQAACRLLARRGGWVREMET